MTNLLLVLLKKGGIFIIISDNPWILAIGIVIFIISIAVKFSSSENKPENSPLNNADLTMYSVCKACDKKKFEMSKGIYCGETNEKPNFKGHCDRFVLKQA